MKWYDKYVGLPYRHLGNSVEKGFDCFNLCRYVAEKEAGIKMPPSSFFCNIAEKNWYNKSTESFIDEGVKYRAEDFQIERVDSPKPFDLITMSIGSTNVTNHCAVYVGDYSILQILENRKSWVTKYNSFYKQYTVGIYRWTLLNS